MNAEVVSCNHSGSQVQQYCIAWREYEWNKYDLSCWLRSMTREQRMTIRVALTGKTVGLDLADVMMILGRNSCIARLDRALRLAGFTEFTEAKEMELNQ